MNFSADILEDFLRTVYEGFDTSNEIEPRMWRELLRILNQAAAQGLADGRYRPRHNDDFLRAIKHNNEVFAAFKVHAMGEAMSSKLLDEKGILKPFKQWLNDVKSISSHQVGAWLDTEYNTAVLRAHAAADWKEFERNKDVMPNLRWMPTTSPHAEKVHRAFWEKKLTLPVEHPFWAKHHPQDRWNCQCSLEATDDPASDDEVTKDLPEVRPHRGLENNPGKDGKLINDTHPYFPKNCGSCAFYKRNSLANLFQNRKKDCNNCPYINGKLPHATQTEKAKELVKEVLETKKAQNIAYKIAELSEIEAKFIKERGVKLSSLDIHISDKAILHAFRDAKKERGAAVSINQLHYFIDNINNPRLCSLYWDKSHQNLMYLTKCDGEIQKYVVGINYKLKANQTKFVTNNFITAARMTDSIRIENSSNYTRIR